MLTRTLVLAALCLAPFAPMPAYAAPAEDAVEDEESYEETEETYEEEEEEEEAPPLRNGGPLGYAMGLDWRTWQVASAVHFRGNPWGPHTESIFTLISRSQALAPSRTYAIDTFGVGLGLGTNLWNFRLGVAAELDWYKRVQASGANPGQLEFVNGVGFLLEPYLAVPLPFLSTPFTQTEIALHWPISPLVPDTAIGPRVMATLWLGPGPTAADFEENLDKALEEELNQELEGEGEEEE